MTEQQQSPIIVEVEGVGELEFPGGTDPAVIQATVKRMTGQPKRLRGAEHLDDALKDPGPLGTLIRAAQGGAPLPLGGQPSALVPLLQRAGKAVSDRAVPLVRSALKPVWATVRRRANIEGVMPSAVANSQARFIAKHQLRTPEQADAMVKSLGGKIDASNAAAAGVTLDTAERVPRYLANLAKRAGGQVLPRADRTAVQRTAAEVLEDSPLSHAVTTQVEREAPSAILDAFGKPMTRKVVEDISSRAMRTDITPSEGMRIARDTSKMSTGKSWGTDPGAVGAKAAEQTVERAVRSSVKAANPEIKPMLRDQGRAMDARSLLDRANWRDANRDQIGMGGIAGLANGRPTIAALLQFLKDKQLGMGLAAARVGPQISRNSQRTAEQLQQAVAALLAGSQ